MIFTYEASVSILVFLEPLLRHNHLKKHYQDFEFQSLFFWNHYLDGPGPCPGRVVAEFQSLFFWNHYLDLGLRYEGNRAAIVSILVFLEPLLRQYLLYNHLCFPVGFNPCFSGTTT